MSVASNITGRLRPAFALSSARIAWIDVSRVRVSARPTIANDIAKNQIVIAFLLGIERCPARFPPLNCTRVSCIRGKLSKIGPFTPLRDKSNRRPPVVRVRTAYRHFELKDEWVGCAWIDLWMGGVLVSA